MTPEEIQAEVQAFLLRRPPGLARWVRALAATAEPLQDFQAACEAWEEERSDFAAEWVEESARTLVAEWTEMEDRWNAAGRPGARKE